ncbi:AMP-binding protein [Sphingopyxis witflariensis]|uniref:AMP-binding protein n=1 Tax=Sphingopyxis witflariensis TaxID=173675 RepID=A0A246K3T2_9SPHN|nr:AMP-binding protein [Sphingopyxis witflariensis]OWR00221.1 AMP-binding protein [Sphingopyxis witflariensis]
MSDIAARVAAFDLDRELAILGDVFGPLNAAVICCDRHSQDGERLALRYRDARGGTAYWTFAALRDESVRLASLLQSIGVRKGDRVAGLLPRTPALLITVLAVWRLGAVYQPLFTAFGPKAIEYRLVEANTKVVVTNGANRSKIEGPTGIAIVNTEPSPGDFDFWSASGSAVAVEPAQCGLDDPFLIMFTSGTTGAPKPLLVPIKAIAAFVGYMRDGIGLEASDRFWNVADPGWAYGLYYAIVGPLALGIATTFYDGPFTAASTYETVEAFDINNLAGAPTAYRLLMGEGAAAASAVKGRLRAVSSAGEPLNPEIIRWFDAHLAAPIFDHYGQTELGMVLCNHHGIGHPVHVGAAGFASPGHRLAILSDEQVELGVGVPGMLALDRSQSPLAWFAGYHGRETSAFVGKWYLTGDTCEINEDGSISFVGRSDDVITTSGYRVGPFDVESALIEHEAVLESAVIGKPDPNRTEIIKAFVVLGEGHASSDALAAELQAHVKARLSAHAFPREIEFVAALPKTPSGKVQRFLLRNQEMAAQAERAG